MRVLWTPYGEQGKGEKIFGKIWSIFLVGADVTMYDNLAFSGYQLGRFNFL